MEEIGDGRVDIAHEDKPDGNIIAPGEKTYRGEIEDHDDDSITDGFRQRPFPFFWGFFLDLFWHSLLLWATGISRAPRPPYFLVVLKKGGRWFESHWSLTIRPSLIHNFK